jgi:hypothetical protein
MAHYRLYFLRIDSHINDAVDLECPDDAAASRLVETHRADRRHDHGMELWQGARRVRAFEAAKRSGLRAKPPAVRFRPGRQGAGLRLRAMSVVERG